MATFSATIHDNKIMEGWHELCIKWWVMIGATYERSVLKITSRCAKNNERWRTGYIDKFNSTHDYVTIYRIRSVSKSFIIRYNRHEYIGHGFFQFTYEIKINNQY
jgi:hypothetical protein